MKLCGEQCVAICDHCRYFVDPPKNADGAFIMAELGWCKRHERPQDILGECDDFYCIAAPADEESRE